MLGDFGEEDIALDQHRAAFVAFLEDGLAAPPGDIDEPDRDRRDDENRDEDRADKRVDRGCPRLLDGGDIGHGRHDRFVDLAVRQRDVDALVGIEIDPVPKRRIELHADELESMLVEAQRKDDEPSGEEGEEPGDDGQLRARKPHQHLMGEELAAACEIA
ncbi:hypothetical protein [Sphingomonas echinoides]|uniref:hypothetical protein n=1 Tax=Sphingomonas echinoides TaxID=59803 RepID=UPI001FDFE11B|nr:hypothetical protein [Sphingomonas echinoides]